MNGIYCKYKSLVEVGVLPDRGEAYKNGSLCRNFINNYISFVTVESPTSSTIKSKREKRVSFNDQLGTIGGTLGLFTGMTSRFVR